MTILALFKNEIPVEVVEVYEVGGVKLTTVKAVRGKPFIGGNKWPIQTEWTIAKATELSEGVVSERCAEEREAIFLAFDAARKAVEAGKLEGKRALRGLVLALASERRPYETTANSCSCPDASNGWCKHRIAELLWMRAGIQRPEQVAEKSKAEIKAERENLLHMALKYQDRKQWTNGECVVLCERKGKPAAWLKNHGGMVSLQAAKVPGGVKMYILVSEGWKPMPNIGLDYRKWVEGARAVR